MHDTYTHAGEGALKLAVAALPSVMGDTAPKALPAGDPLAAFKAQVRALADKWTSKTADQIKVELLALASGHKYLLWCHHNMTFEIREYIAGGQSPFADWFNALDAVAAARVDRYIRRLEAGKFGNVKTLLEGLAEPRIDYGRGIASISGAIVGP